MAKLIEMALEQVVNSQAELTDAELEETALVFESMTTRAIFLEKQSPEDQAALARARSLRTILALLGRILARAIRLKALKEGTKP